MASAQGYAESLSDYSEKGELNLRNTPDAAPAVLHKARLLAEMIRDSPSVVIHTGAGISTSAGIADFRGPQGVWTTESRPRKKPRRTVPFHRAIPTITHMAIAKLHSLGHINFVISQNVDSLHLRSGLPRRALSELHGNIFVEYCPDCRREHLRDLPVSSVGLQPTGNTCQCGGALRDQALDWEDPLPEPDFENAKQWSEDADLNIVLGTSCQMEPARRLPFRGGRGKAAAALVNLSVTPCDDRFGFRIRAKCDDVFAVVCRCLGVKLGVFERECAAVLQAVPVDPGLMECRLRGAQGEPLEGVQDVRYYGTSPAGPAFRATVPSDAIYADVVFDDGREQHVPQRGSVRLVVQRKDWNADVATLERDVGRLARAYEGVLDAAEFFVAGKRRGWSVCCICRAEVWCSRGKRESHVAECWRRNR